MVEIGNDIDKAKMWLAQGALVGIPTETVYGLAANGLRPDAISKIYEAKNRPSFNPLILHIPYANEAKKYAAYFPDSAQQLAAHFWPGPLTIVLPKQPHVLDILTAGQATVALRVPQHPLTLRLLRSIDFPLAAPSANPSGYISPTEAEHVAAQMSHHIKYVLDGGKCQVGIESTIVKCDADQIFLLRPGAITSEEIEEATGLKIQAPASKKTEAPGMMAAHYAPSKKFFLGNISKLATQYQHQKIGVLSWMPTPKIPNAVMQLSLSEQGNLSEAAQNIFAYLRKLDQADLEVIIGEWVPEQGIGIAINDRLKRAAHLSSFENDLKTNL